MKYLNRPLLSAAAGLVDQTDFISDCLFSIQSNFAACECSKPLPSNAPVERIRKQKYRVIEVATDKILRVLETRCGYNCHQRIFRKRSGIILLKPHISEISRLLRIVLASIKS